MNLPLHVVRRWWRHNGGPSDGHPRGGRLAGLEADACPSPAPVDASRPWLDVLTSVGVPHTLVYPSTTLGRLLDQSADRFGDAVAMAYNDRTWTYRELLEQVNRVAGGLASLGVRRGERVLLTLPNCPEFVIDVFRRPETRRRRVNAGPLMGADDLKKVIAMTTPLVAIGLDLRPRADLRRLGRRHSNTGSGCRWRRTRTRSTAWATA